MLLNNHDRDSTVDEDYNDNDNDKDGRQEDDDEDEDASNSNSHSNSNSASMMSRRPSSASLATSMTTPTPTIKNKKNKSKSKNSTNAKGNSGAKVATTSKGALELLTKGRITSNLAIYKPRELWKVRSSFLSFLSLFAFFGSLWFSTVHSVFVFPTVDPSFFTGRWNGLDGRLTVGWLGSDFMHACI